MINTAISWIHQYHLWMSHGTHINESWQTYKWIMAHVQMSHGARTHESWHTYGRNSRAPWWIQRHYLWMRHGTHMKALHIYDWVMAHIWTRHCTHMIELWHTYERVIAHKCMSHGTYMKGSWHTYGWVMTHTRSSHGTHTRKSQHAYTRVMARIQMSLQGMYICKYIYTYPHSHKLIASVFEWGVWVWVLYVCMKERKIDRDEKRKRETERDRERERACTQERERERKEKEEKEWVRNCAVPIQTERARARARLCMCACICLCECVCKNESERVRKWERGKEGKRKEDTVSDIDSFLCVPYRLNSDVEGWHVEGLKKNLMYVTWLISYVWHDASKCHVPHSYGKWLNIGARIHGSPRFVCVWQDSFIYVTHVWHDSMKARELMAVLVSYVCDTVGTQTHGVQGVVF